MGGRPRGGHRQADRRGGGRPPRGPPAPRRADNRAGITHVIRGKDMLPSTPRQLAVYAALEAEPPTYAHLPMVLGTDKKKLSKRHGAVSVEEFRDRGILAQALINYLALVGWSYDDHTTVMTIPELIERFSLERVNSSPACSIPRSSSG